MVLQQVQLFLARVNLGIIAIKKVSQHIPNLQNKNLTIKWSVVQSYSSLETSSGEGKLNSNYCRHEEGWAPPGYLCPRHAPRVAPSTIKLYYWTSRHREGWAPPDLWMNNDCTQNWFKVINNIFDEKDNLGKWIVIFQAILIMLPLILFL